MSRKYLTLADGAVGLKNKDVLEVGGCVDAAELIDILPNSWTSIDINERRVQSVRHDPASPIKHSVHIMNACSMNFDDESFDRIYSINCFEHINGIEDALSEMYRVLRKGGYLFSIFGPIWSSPVGHHTYIETDKGLIHFNNNVLPDWQHLKMSVDEFTAWIKGSYPEDLSKKIVGYIYNSDDINRLVDGDYYNYISASAFSPVLIMKNRKGSKLNKSEVKEFRRINAKIVDPRTTEILVVLKKGSSSVFTTALSVMGLGAAMIKLKMA